MDPDFSSSRLSLLDRGFVYAIAHVRGGEELGRAWYEDGKLLKKQNSFHDFIDVTEALVARGYGARDQVYAMGAAPAACWMGAVINQAPQLYRGVVAQVPFVDVVTTMLDESIPLTTGSTTSGATRNQKRYYDYMLAYSPYDQVKAQATPICWSPRAARLPGAVLGARQVGRQAAGAEDGRQPAAAEHRHGRRSRRQVGALQGL